MKEKVINVPNWSAALKKIGILGKRTENCWIYIDEELIPKNLIVESKKTKGVYYLKQKEYKMEFDSHNEKNQRFWLVWYLFEANGNTQYLINFFDETVHYYIKKDSKN